MIKENTGAITGALNTKMFCKYNLIPFPMILDTVDVFVFDIKNLPNKNFVILYYHKMLEKIYVWF